MNTAIIVSIIVVAALVILFGLFLWASYTSLKMLRSRVDEAWRDIESQLEQRAELVPVFVGAVQKHASHEQAVLRSAETARAETLAATTPQEATAAENHLQQALRGVLAVADGFPKLAASADFLEQQSELGQSEERLQTSRRFYNGGVREYNTKLGVFPNTMFARREGFERREFFEVADGTTKAAPPRVQF